MIENYAPGTMDRRGSADEALCAANPRLIYCALKGFLSGPYEHRPALDEVVQFMAGLVYMTGPPGQPLRAGNSVVDIMGGMFAVIGIQAALRERDRTGRSQVIKSALFETTAFLMAQHMAGQAITGRAPPPMPAREGAWGIYDPFALGYAAISAQTPREALQQLESHTDVALLFTDIVMPEMNGRVLSDMALARQPNLKVLYTTGYTRNAIVHNGVLDAGTALIQKPFTLEQLALKLRQALGR